MKKTINIQNLLKDFLDGFWGSGSHFFFFFFKDTFDWRLEEEDCHLCGLLGQLGVFWPVPSAEALWIQLLPWRHSRAIAPQSTWSITAFIYLGLSLCQPLNMSHALSALGLPPLRWPLLHFTRGTKEEGDTIAQGHHSIVVQVPDSKWPLCQSPVIRL